MRAVGSRPALRGETAGWRIVGRRLDVAPHPELAFVELFGREPAAFWLDSSLVEPGLSRWSFMGAARGPRASRLRYDTASRRLEVITAGGVETRTCDLFDYLRRELRLQRAASEDLPFDFQCGFVGYFGYELKNDCGARLVHRFAAPDANLLFVDRLLAFDHAERRVYLAALAGAGEEDGARELFDAVERRLARLPASAPEPAPGPRAPVRLRLRTSYPRYLDQVERCLRHIRDGESYEICLTHQIGVDAQLDPLALYRILRRRNPAPYSAFLRFPEIVVMSSSPERFLRIEAGAEVESKPIKGTMPRGRTPEEDREIERQLRTSAKDRAENLMIVDLMRNDLGRVCEVGSVRVPKLMAIESYRTVHQMVSTIRGRLRPGISPVDCLRHAFPGGSITGAPKLRTMEILDALETEARGVYTGSLGYLALNGAADLSIVIRTLTRTARALSLGVGGAIVALSDPAREFDETLLKARALLDAVAEAAGCGFGPGRYAELCAELKATAGAEIA